MSKLAENAAREFLTAKGWPVALQNYVLTVCKEITPFRYFICDDSGSMAAGDGKKLVVKGSETKFQSCSRWNELTDALRFHANLAELMQLPTEFRLLNQSQAVVVGGDGPSHLEVVLNLLNGTPSGDTPLCRHIREVVKRIETIENHLRSTSQKAVIIIATDGESSDGDVAKALEPLRNLPVHIVVRLCTDDSKIVDYWNNIDNEIEVDIDVLDDYMGEAAEVRKLNSWLTYGEPLHRLREFGVPMKELDMLDEKSLTGDQVKRLCTIIMDKPMSSIPDPNEDLEAFVAFATEALSEVPTTWCPFSKTQKPWLDLARLRRHFGPKGATDIKFMSWLFFVGLIVLLVSANSYLKWQSGRKW